MHFVREPHLNHFNESQMELAQSHLHCSNGERLHVRLSVSLATLPVPFAKHIGLATLVVLVACLAQPIFAAPQVKEERVQVLERADAIGRIRGGVAAPQDEEDAADAEDDGEEGPNDVKGPLTEISDDLSKLISFEWKNGVLEPKLLEGRQEVQQTIYSIRSASGGGGMSSSSSGDNSWWYQFQGQRLTGTFQNNWPRNQSGKLMFNIVELEAPFRELKIQKTENDQLSILLSGGTLPFILRVKQDSNGEFVVQEVNGVEVFSHREKNFGEFCRKHVEYSQNHLLPLLKTVGIQPPPTPQDLVVQETVIERLKPLDAARVEEFRQLIANLDSSSFEEREESSKIVAEQFENYRDIVERSIDDDSYSAEARTRLLTLLKEKSEDATIRTRDVISRLELTEDPIYLVWLLEQRESPEDKALLVDTLTTLTEESYGDDLAQWKEWAGTAAEVELPVTDVQVDSEIIFSDGQLIKMRDHTAKLVKLAIVDGTLQIDRDHWSVPFGGKTLAAISDEIKAEIRARGMPESYFNGIDTRRYPMLGYPHVLFESFYQELLKHPDRNNTYSSRSTGSNFTPNRSVSANGVECSIATQPGANGRVIGRANNDSKQFRIRFAEQNVPRRSIAIEEDEDLNLRVEVTCDDSDTIVRLIEMSTDQGWVIQDLRGTEVFADQADSYQALYDANQAYFDETFFPLLDKLGFIPPEDSSQDSSE